MQVKYSIIICTYNRAPLLKETLDSLLSILESRLDFEILVVDNNSNDNTAKVCEQYNVLSFIKYIFEDKAGLSYARNRGIKESKGKILVFLDDDIDISVKYFSICDELFSRPEVQIAGGKVLPYNVMVPQWLPVQYYYLVSIFDLGDEPMYVKYIMGGNCAIRKEVTKKVGYYDYKLGRKGTNLMGGEENDYQDRAKKLGYKVYYDPRLTIYHKIENKLNKQYVLSYAYQNGLSTALFIKRQWGISKFALKIIKAKLMIILYYIYGRYVQDERTKTFYFIQNRYSQGYLYGVLKSTMGYKAN